MPVIQVCWDQSWGGEERRISGDGKPVCLIAGTDQSETLSQKIKKKSFTWNYCNKYKNY